MRAVWKYPMQWSDRFSVEAPAVFRPLHVEPQGNEVMIWAEVDPVSPMVPQSFQMVGTGHLEIPDEGAEYVGTFLTNLDTYVWHLYWLKDV